MQIERLRAQQVLSPAEVTAVLAVVADAGATPSQRQQALDLLEIMVEDLELAPRLLDLPLDATTRPAVEVALDHIAQRLVAAGAPEPAGPPGDDASEGTRILWRLANRT